MVNLTRLSIFQLNQIVKFEEKMCRIRNDEWKEGDELKNALSRLIK